MLIQVDGLPWAFVKSRIVMALDCFFEIIKTVYAR